MKETVPGQYFNKGLGLKKQVASRLTDDYTNALVKRLREEGGTLSEGRVTLRMAKELGFCYGVERAIQYAYETVEKFPGKRLFLTSEIIHNPSVNARMTEMGIDFLAHDGAEPDLSRVAPGDVVVIPAFGVPVPLMGRLRASGAVLVDTTCGSVIQVWRRVEQYAREGVTAIVHGKHEHEETRATCSCAEAAGGRYLVVRDMAEAKLVCAYIEGTEDGGRKKAFLERFAKGVSPGFDPDRDLRRVGLANQTTMLSSESMAIAREIERAIARRWGAETAKDAFRSFDTICTATQDRQDAIQALVKEPLDLMIVVGGYTSSNTMHLAEIPAERMSTYWVEGPDGLLDARRIRTKEVAGPVRVAEGWLPAEGALTVGITAGASTPDSLVGETIARLFELANGRPLSS